MPSRWPGRWTTTRAALVVVSGATQPWPGGIGPLYSVTATSLGGAVLAPMIAAFVTEAQANGVLQSVFAPQPVPDGYAEHVGDRADAARGSRSVPTRDS